MASLYMQLIGGALLMRAGLAMHSVGSVRSKNAASVMGRHLLDWSIAVLAFWAVGEAIAYQTANPFIGLDASLLLGRGRESALLISGLCRAMVVGAFVIGATAERSRLWPMLALSVLTTAVTWPIMRAWAGSNGWLAAHHFAGGAAVYLVGGATAIGAVLAVGPRDGKYHRDGSASVFPGHNFSFTAFGALIFAIGAALCTSHFANIDGDTQIINMCLAMAAAVFAAALYSQLMYSKIDLPLVACALLAGVVSTSACGAYVAGWGAVLVGLLVGVFTPITLVKLDMVLKLDDVTGMITIAAGAGLISTLVAIPFEETTWPERAKALLVQGAGAGVILISAGAVAYFALKLIGRFTALRANDTDEFDGLDLAEHDMGAYPDFQQNTIKSYHLREA